MPKLYELTITLRPAEFSGNSVSVSYSLGASVSRKEYPFTGTLADALTERERLASIASFPCAAFLGMTDRHARKPPGFNAAPHAVYFRR